ncbi:hypothetical protein E2C01_012800 [Portunus trituberculatus]|uniref:Uncharacterized protein n=1 Tax=Portunus trituberculatus TaxID=210409 RepID=A0A5B7DFD6_PORTR|nr:hypothetical protein [Portunus trituberculatus]
MQKNNDKDRSEEIEEKKRREEKRRTKKRRGGGGGAGGGGGGGGGRVVSLPRGFQLHYQHAALHTLTSISVVSPVTPSIQSNTPSASNTCSPGNRSGGGKGGREKWGRTSKGAAGGLIHTRSVMSRKPRHRMIARTVRHWRKLWLLSRSRVAVVVVVVKVKVVVVVGIIRKRQ